MVYEEINWRGKKVIKWFRSLHIYIRTKFPPSFLSLSFPRFLLHFLSLFFIAASPKSDLSKPSLPFCSQFSSRSAILYPFHPFDFIPLNHQFFRPGIDCTVHEFLWFVEVFFSSEERRVMQRQTLPPPSSRKQLPFTSMKPPFGGGAGGEGGDYHHFATGDAQRPDQEFSESVVVKKRPVSVKLFSLSCFTSNWRLSSISR